MDRGEAGIRFRLTDKIHTSYYNHFFMLKVLVDVNEQTVDIGISEKNVVLLSSQYPEASVSFDSTIAFVDTVIRQHGASGVSRSWYENKALMYELTLRPGDNLCKLLRTSEEFHTTLAGKIEAALSQKLVEGDYQATPPPLSVGVHTELYLVTPNAAKKSSVNLIPVTNDSLLICLGLWRESKVFEFDAAFTAHGAKHTQEEEEEFEPGLMNQELNSVAEWYSLGISLGLPKAELDVIRQEFSREGALQCRFQMLTLWYDRHPDVTWYDLLKALILMSRVRLAHKLALKYRVPVPPMPEPVEEPKSTACAAAEPSSPAPLQVELLERVEGLRRMLQDKDKVLEEKEKLILKSKARRDAMSKEQDEMKQKLKINEKKNVALQMEKRSLEQELKYKGVELKLLKSAQHDARWLREADHLHEMIEEKKKRMKIIKGQLVKVEQDLQSERALTQNLRTKVSHLESELREKVAELHCQEKKALRTKYELKEQRHELDQITQLRAANSSQEALLQEVLHQVSVTIEERRVKSSEVEQHKASIAEKEAEIQQLLQQLQQQQQQHSSQSSQPQLQREKKREVTEALRQINKERATAILQLQGQLLQAEEAKSRAEGELATAQLQIRRLRKREEEFRGLQLTAQNESLPPVPPLPSRVEEPPNVLRPRARLQWRRCANAPVKIARTHAVVVEGKVYVGGGYTSGSFDDDHQVFQYCCREDTWDSLPLCPVRGFTMAQFRDDLVVVGGEHSDNAVTGKLHTFTEAANEWRELLPPMPTARCFLSVVTTSKIIVAAGGNIGSGNVCATVEVYSVASSQWHTTDPLPSPSAYMSSAIIDTTCYLLGGSKGFLFTKDCFHASVDLMEKVVRCRPHLPSIWKCLSDTPLKCSTAVSLRGCLVALGGLHSDDTKSTALHTFLKSWVPLTSGDLPAPRSCCTAASLSQDEVIVIGGWDERGNRCNTVWIGTVVVQ